MSTQESEELTVGVLRKAVDRGEFAFYFQPIVSMVSGRISGAEALMRWIQPDGTVIPPVQFIPFAEQSGYIEELTLAMLPQFLDGAEQIIQATADTKVTFNVPGGCFYSNDLTSRLLAALEERLRPHQIAVELTETSIMEESPSVRSNLKRLSEAGIDLCMDDFSTGYSNLDLLSRFDFKAVKIDQGMIRRMTESEKATTMIFSVIRMAIKIGMDVVAEGIEDEAVYTFLLQLGCTRGQGYWMGRPMPLEEFIAHQQAFRHLNYFPAGLIHHAQLNHLEWRASIIRGMCSLGRAGKGFPVKDPNLSVTHHTCLLGQWIDTAGQKYAGFKPFDDLYTPHQQLHQIGEDIVRTIDQGGNIEEIRKMLGQLTERSSLIIRLLEELEDESVMSQSCV